MSVHVRVTASEYDRLDHLARDARVNIPEWIRRRLADDDEDDA